ncbi:MAG: tetratricopeptide repeat protein, partial [Spirochaetaceae bacterium]|nr:tetratricopeptide repeat protein [Spirochaetaceae bacterium]
RVDPVSPRRFEVPYQKGRALFYLKQYNEALIMFKDYADSIQVDGRYIRGMRAETWNETTLTTDAYNRKSSAIYWIGECLYNLEQFDRAAEMFELIVKQYPSSVKYEPSLNRLDLIKQKKTAEGLLEIIRLSNLPSDPASVTVDNQEKKAAKEDYDDAVLAYKNSIAPFLMRDTEVQPTVVETPVKTRNSTLLGTQDPDTMMRLLNIKTQALELMDRLTSTMNAFETIEVEKWDTW